MEKSEIQDQALEALSKVTRGSVSISVGVGKTLIGLRHMASIFTVGSKFLVVAPKISIFQSWKDEAKKFGMEYLIEHITFTTYLSLKKQTEAYTAAYLDEGHNILKSHEPWLKDFKGVLVALTGSKPKHSYSEKGKLFDKYMPVVYEYNTDNAVEDGLLNDYEIIVHMLNLSTAKTLTAGKAPKLFMTSELDNYNYWTSRCNAQYISDKDRMIMRIMRMKTIMSFPSKDAYVKTLLDKYSSQEKIILFANTQEQADSFGIPSYHSNNQDSVTNLEKFKLGEITDLACVLQISEGINIPNLKMGIIMHAYGNERKLKQRLGRLFRLNPDDKCTAHILCYKDTADETWVRAALEDYDQSKITYLLT